MKELLEYFKGDELAANVWLGKYAQEGDKTPDDMHKRMAKEFARIEENYIGLAESRDTAKLSKYGLFRDNLTKESIYELFKDFKWIIPQGSVMANLGNSAITSLSNCFVIGQPVDSYGGILRKDEQMAQLMKRRGGVGLDISTLRPKGIEVSNAAKSSTGMASFMPRYSNTTREVAQDGRRGALMLSIDINHPDSLDFIKIKRDLSQVTGANISVKISEEFMKAVENDERYVLRFPCDFYEKNETWVKDLEEGKNNAELNVLQPIISGNDTIGYTKVIKAKEYWEEVIKSAHGSAEPGIIFEDNHHNYSPDGVYPQFKGVTTNPCGEIFMQEYDACRLIVINYFSFVKNPFTPEASFDFAHLYKVAYEAMRLSDDLIDLEVEHIDRILRKIMEDEEPFEDKRTEFELWTKIKETAQASRRTGLGFTALGDTLAALGLKYDSDESLKVIDKISKTKFEGETDCTIDLASLRGTFTGWNKDLEVEQHFNDLNTDFVLEGKNDFYEMMRRDFPEKAMRMWIWGRRNVSISTVAPTGTTSLMSQTTSGIEPLFAPYYFRRKKINPNDVGVRVDFTDDNGDKWQEFPVLHPKFKDWIETQIKLGGTIKVLKQGTINLDFSKNEGEDIPIDITDKRHLDLLFVSSPYYKSTANDIDWIKRVEIQGIVQKYTTHSISSTINLPNSVTEKEVSDIYFESWKKGLKGITVYRDGSRSGVLITESTKDKQTFEYKDAPKRPKELDGEVHLISVKGVSYKVIIGLFDNKPYEIFIDESENKISGRGLILKKSRGNYYFKKDDITTDITSAMSDEQAAITRLTSTALRHGADIKFVVEQLLKCDGDLFSFTKSLARVLKKYIPDGVKSTVSCQDCGSENVIFQEGCQTCQDCGNSRCG
jgi:ribonucleoside-diphosphate reductase alpha chain